MLSQSLKKVGHFIFRYGLAIAFIWLGLMKLKNMEADYLKELLKQSSLFSWMLKYITSYTFSLIIAYTQMTVGVMLALKPVARKVSFWGGVVACVLLIVSVSALFTSSYVWQPPYGFPDLSKFGQSLLKDIVLLGAALWCTGDSA
ncbi:MULTISPECIES: DUF417 family protein [unclassified Carboxylicivirga]|uniref:DUF417 family protein n=1 Tax=Carboxylicivirga TaxID=1628153 RepID=UPI003D33BF9B